MDILLSDHLHVLNSRREFLVSLWFSFFWYSNGISLHVGFSSCDFLNLTLTKSLQDDRAVITLVITRHIKGTNEACIDTCHIDIVYLRVINIAIFLTYNCYNRVWVLLQVLDKSQSWFSANEDRGENPWEHNEVTGYENRDFAINLYVQVWHVSFVISNHLYRAILFHKVLLYLLLACKGTK